MRSRADVVDRLQPTFPGNDAPDWLAKIEALQPGDRCEVKDHSTMQWLTGRVFINGGAGYWVIDVNGNRWHRYIEEVRCVGQTEAWPMLSDRQVEVNQ